MYGVVHIASIGGHSTAQQRDVRGREGGVHVVAWNHPTNFPINVLNYYIDPIGKWCFCVKCNLFDLN